MKNQFPGQSEQPSSDSAKRKGTPEHRQAQEQSLGQFLINEGKIEKEDLAHAMHLQQGSDGSLSALLVKLGLVSEVDITEALGKLFSLPIAGEKDYLNIPPLAELLSPAFLKEHNVLPLATDQEQVWVAIADPMDNYTIRAIGLVYQKPVRCRIGQPSQIQEAIERVFGSGKTQMAKIVEDIAPAQSEVSQQEITHLKDLASEAPVIRLVNLILQHAVEASASDIHIEPFENKLNVRYRIDGMLREEEAPPMHLYPAVVSRIKIMSNLDIAERRLPQDGRFMAHAGGREIDVRVSTVPTLYGESMVMRLLYKDYAMLDFSELGFEGDTFEKFIEVLHRPYGVLLVTGPTGSGKTTTLYAALNLLNEASSKILTVEDPVEYQIEGVNQIQVKPHINLTFANALRSIVRQDPDIIMIGEMRDLETAEIAVQSALTGHLVLSTLHTNDAASSITRLMDMGIAEYLVTSVLNGVLAQRLVRRLCPACRQAYQPLPELVQKLQLQNHARGGGLTLYQPVGCEQCNNSGYRGRVALLEILVLSDRIRRQILNHSDARDIARAAIEEGMRTMYEDGMQKVLKGITSVEEVLRATREI